MKKNLLCAAAAVMVAVAFAACSNKSAETEATEENTDSIAAVEAVEVVEAVDTVAGDTLVAVEGEVVEAPVVE